MDESPDFVYLQWDEWNLDHVQKHGLQQKDVVFLVEHTSIAERTYKDRWLLLGPTGDGTIMALIVGEVPDQPGWFYPFSARPASRKERAKYEQRTAREENHGNPEE